ncbi:ABC transporter [Streptomyces sp. NPDC048392]|uniref:ABC transporter n=1 Tax=Streptomyces sp. NPDC048392 TaxID=3365543 RepID=UPI00371B7ABE
MRGVTADLVAPLWRTLPWRALAAAGTVGLLAAATPVVTGAAPAPWQTLLLLRGVALIGAVGLAFLLDDPARHLTAPVPTPRPVRQALRVALAAPFAALWWTAALLLVPSASRPPVGDVTLEAAAVGALALAGAAMAVRLTDEARPGPFVAASLLLTAVLVPLLAPADWALFVQPDDPRWPAAHDRWALLAPAAAALGALCGPEPVGRRGRGTARKVRGAGGPV